MDQVERNRDLGGGTEFAANIGGQHRLNHLSQVTGIGIDDQWRPLVANDLPARLHLLVRRVDKHVSCPTKRMAPNSYGRDSRHHRSTVR
jgi:hypothetical protein